MSHPNAITGRCNSGHEFDGLTKNHNGRMKRYCKKCHAHREKVRRALKKFDPNNEGEL